MSQRYFVLANDAAPRLRREGAFTLLELSLVLGVMALLLAGVMSMVTQNVRRESAAEVKQKMDDIEAALLSFRRLNGRLPCPADSTQAVSSQNFGVEGTATAVAATSCVNNNTYSNYSDLASDNGGTAPTTPDASFYDGANTVAGDVPVRTLGLPDTDMFDPWGGRFAYAVDNRMTTITNPSAFDTYNVTNTSIGAMSVNDTSGNVKQPHAIAVLLSYGPDGHGAFQLSGVRKSIGNSNASTLTNCHCTNAAAASAVYSLTTFIQSPATSANLTDTNGFDDIVRAYNRASFLNTTDTLASR